MIFQHIIQAVLVHKKSIIVLLTIAMLGGLGQTLRLLEVDNSLSIWFLEDNADYQEYLAFQEEQGSDEVIIVMIPTKDALAQNHIQRLKELHQKTDSLPYVKTTFSLATAKYPIYSNRKIYYRNIYQASRTKESIEQLLTELPALSRQLLTVDQRHSFFYVQLLPTNKVEANRSKIVDNIQTLVENTFEPTHISGAPILNEAFNHTIYKESLFFAVVSLLVILILLLFLLPHWHYIPIAFFAIALPVSLTLGLMTTMGYALNLISMLIPTILMIYSISDLIHIVNIFHLHRKEQPLQSKHKQIKIALYDSLKPCFYTTLTTVIGYLALVFSPLPAFKIMGMFTFIGLIIAFGLVYVIAAIGFSFLNEKSLDGDVRKINISVLTQRINHWTSKYNTTILGMGGIVFLLGIISLFAIEVSTDSLNLLGKGKVKNDLQIIEETLAGSTRLQLNIYKTNETSLLQKEALQKLKQFQKKLDSNPLLSYPVSIVNFQSFLENRSSIVSKFSPIKFEKILRSNQEDTNTFFSLFGDDFSYIAININIKELETKALEQLLVNIKKDFRNTFSEEVYGLKIHGFSALYAQLNTFILQTQFRSFGAAFIISFCILFYFIGQFKMGLLALIPNLLPLFSAFIVMFVGGIHLEIANAMLAPIMLGVAMDDTIHLMNKFKKNKRAGLSTTESINKALTYTGGALFSTTISLVCGFLIVGLSSVISVSIFGFLCAFTILAALLADVCFLPALVKYNDRN
ncbi:MAG: MMPL family transporter [Chitinophagales bacterium]|nr:MMPL family transporter [Chitinophagales bacterium]